MPPYFSICKFISSHEPCDYRARRSLHLNAVTAGLRSVERNRLAGCAQGAGTQGAALARLQLLSGLRPQGRAEVKQGGPRTIACEMSHSPVSFDQVLCIAYAPLPMLTFAAAP